MFDIVPPWIKWLGALFAAVAVMAAIYAYGQQQFGLGAAAERAHWLARENAELLAANSTIIELNRQARDRERRFQADIAAISAGYQEGIKNVETKKDRVIADLRTGNQRLRIPVAATGNASSGIAPEALSAAASRDGAARAELSAEAAEFLVGLASEADQIVAQLAACQQIITQDRAE